MRLTEQAIDEIGRLLNGTNNSQHAAIGHLATAATRAAESLVYLAGIDDLRFNGTWPDDSYQNDAVDDGHVRWASAGALTREKRWCQVLQSRIRKNSAFSKTASSCYSAK